MILICLEEENHMKRMKKIMALALAMVMVLAMGMTVFAEGDGGTSDTPAETTTTPSTPSITINAASETGEGATDTAVYTWYRILEADIAQDPTMDTDGVKQKDGKVAYYVTTEARATALAGLKVPKNDGTAGNVDMFEVTRVGTTDKWYVSLKNEATSAADIETAFKSQLDLTKFETGTFHQTAVAGTATSGEVDPGYYYITSTAGMKAVIQTLTAVTINEKNTYPPVTKTVDNADKNAQIGDEITYTLTVEVPASANDVIVLTDTMDDGLTFKSIDSCKSNAEGTPDVTYHTLLTGEEASDVTLTAANVTTNSNTFRIKFDKDTVVANRDKTITIKYTAVLNNKAVVGTADKNTVTLKYGNNYESKPKETETKTYSVKFDKVDGDNTATKLTGAQFKLTKNSTATKAEEVSDEEWIKLIEVTAGVEYRVAMSEDTATPVKVITTNGNVVTINGLDSDTTYYLWETKAPTGYNVLTSPITLTATSSTSGEGDAAVTTYSFADQTIKNNKGSVLPSTGGIGTTIFYVIGSVLVVAAGVLLVTKKRMGREE